MIDQLELSEPAQPITGSGHSKSRYQTQTQNILGSIHQNCSIWSCYAIAVHVLVGVTQVPCLTVHGHDQEIGLWKVQCTHSFVDDVRIFQKQLLNFLLVLPVEVIQDVSQLVHLVAELGWVL